MITREEMQEAVGPAWKVGAATARLAELSMPETTENREAFLIQLEKVRELAGGHQESEGCDQCTAAWYAAEVLLGPTKYDGLVRLMGSEPDGLTDTVVAMALLGTTEMVEESCLFEASDVLLAGVNRLTEEAMTVTAQSVELGGATALKRLWAISCAAGWTEFLPTTFEMRKLGEWETDEMFRTRCASTLALVEKMFP